MAFEAVKAKWHSECWMVQRRPAPISCEEMYRGRKIWRFWQKNLEENWEVNRFHGFLQCFLYYVSTMCQTNNRDLQHVCTNFYQQNYWAMFTRLIDKTTKTCWGPRLKTMRLCTTRLVVQTWFLTIWFHLWQSQSRIPDFVTVESLFINDSQWFNCTGRFPPWSWSHYRGYETPETPFGDMVRVLIPSASPFGQWNDDLVVQMETGG